jgi:hypothetical protein
MLENIGLPQQLRKAANMLKNHKKEGLNLPKSYIFLPIILFFCSFMAVNGILGRIMD